MLLQKNVNNDSCLDFSDGHFKLLHTKICSKIKKLRILGLKWRIGVGPMSIRRRSNFCLIYSITTIIPNTSVYFCVNKHSELIYVLSIKVITDHTWDKHLVLTFVSNICPMETSKQWPTWLRNTFSSSKVCLLNYSYLKTWNIVQTIWKPCLYTLI